MFAITLLLVYTACAHAQQVGDRTEVYSWVALDYDWPNDTVKEEYVTSGKFVVQNNIITGIKEVGECSALQYVQSMEVDPNTGLMWIIDSGRVTSGSTGNTCPLKLIVYDIDQDREVRRFVFPSHMASPSTVFLNDIVLEYQNGCVTHAYITDSRGAKLYVYDVAKNEAYFFTDPTMQTEPPGTGTAIDGIAMSADFDFLYYCPLEGMGLFQVPTAVLHDKTANFSQHVRRVGNRTDRSGGLAYGQDYLYYGLFALNGVERWDVTRDAEGVGYDHVTMTSQEVVMMMMMMMMVVVVVVVMMMMMMMTTTTTTTTMMMMTMPTTKKTTTMMTTTTTH
nr:hypothetical protein BaRGS_034644 [Batillaria attramentaria]